MSFQSLFTGHHNPNHFSKWVNQQIVHINNISNMYIIMQPAAVCWPLGAGRIAEAAVINYLVIEQASIFECSYIGGSCGPLFFSTPQSADCDVGRIPPRTLRPPRRPGDLDSRGGTLAVPYLRYTQLIPWPRTTPKTPDPLTLLRNLASARGSVPILFRDVRAYNSFVRHGLSNWRKLFTSMTFGGRCD